MAKHFDLTNILSEERPTLKLGDKTYTINDEKSNVLAMNNQIGSGKLSEDEMIDTVITRLLGKKALSELGKLGLGVSQYKNIFFALVAGVNDLEIEEVKNQFSTPR